MIQTKFIAVHVVSFTKTDENVEIIKHYASIIFLLKTLKNYNDHNTSRATAWSFPPPLLFKLSVNCYRLCLVSSFDVIFMVKVPPSLFHFSFSKPNACTGFRMIFKFVKHNWWDVLSFFFYALDNEKWMLSYLFILR